MPFKTKSDYISWAILIGILLLLIEVTFFNGGLIFSLLVASGMVYVGRKRLGRLTGKLLFWIGIFVFAMSVITMHTFKFLLLAILIYLIVKYAKSKKHPERIKPMVKEPVMEVKQEKMIRKKSLFDSILLGDRKTPDHVYEWNDVNIQTGIGDTTIDLSYTVLPKGETVIFVRNFIGNVQILVPYDIEVCVNHSAVTGTTRIFGITEEKLFNQTILMQTEEYEKAEQKIKIFTSFIIGDLEVKRA